jgi:hypothetical protein
MLILVQFGFCTGYNSSDVIVGLAFRISIPFGVRD